MEGEERSVSIIYINGATMASTESIGLYVGFLCVFVSLRVHVFNTPTVLPLSVFCPHSSSVVGSDHHSAYFILLLVLPTHWRLGGSHLCHTWRQGYNYYF